jgi:hypothetical protein
MTDQTEATPSQELKFSKKALADLPTTGKQYSVRDPKTPGLVLLVTPKGAKAFYSYRWINGKPERFKLGTFETMTLDEAISLQQSLVKMIATHAKGYGLPDSKTGKMLTAEMCGSLATLTEAGEPAHFGLIITVTK